MTAPIRFGTDGWRAIIAQDFTFDNVRACAQAVADHLTESGLGDRGLLVGYDTRFASEDFAAAAAEVVAANKIRVYLCPRATPTPTISYGVQANRAGGAIIITASHNPANWNGFKYKSEHGGSASSQIGAELESRVSGVLSRGAVQRLPLAEGLEQGMIEYLDLAPAYLEHIAELVDLENIRQAGLRIAVDSMYGAGAGYFKRLLAGGSTQIAESHGRRNTLFPGIRPEPIAPNLTGLSARVKRSGASVGLATDGDADRIGIVDEKGESINPLQVFPLLALYLLEVRGQRGAIVKSLATSSMLYRLGELFGVPVHETPVGFKYIAPLMLTEDVLIGGEESGGYGFRGHVPERDGIVAGIYFLDLMVRLGKTPSQLLAYLYDKVGPHHYHRLDFELAPGESSAIADRVLQGKPEAINGIEVTKLDTSDGFRFLLADGSWLLIRASGTEPVLRLYAESDSLAGVERLLETGRRLTGVGDDQSR
jgi:phosphomannomutase